MLELREIITLPQRLAGNHESWRRLLTRDVVQLARHYPRTFLTVTLAAAAIGAGYLLLFPYLLYAMPRALYDLVPAAHTPWDWLFSGVMLAILALGATVTWTLFRLRFSQPAGRILTREEAPALFRLLAELHTEYGKPAVHRLLLDDGADVRIVKTPCGGLSPFTRRTLIIGLPVLQTVSTAQLRVLLARCIGQLSPGNRDISTWLYQLNDTWAQYAELRHHASFPARLIGLFFSHYSPIYRTLSLGLEHRVELHADHCILAVINDQIAVEGISAHAASRDYLVKRFWPTIERMATQNGNKEPFLPFQHMTEVVRNSLSGQKLNDAVMRLYQEENGRDAQPGLRERLENIGHDQPLPVPEMTSTAANDLLKQSLPEIVREFDQRWLKRRAG